jgi:hypothetical protein
MRMAHLPALWGNTKGAKRGKNVAVQIGLSPQPLRHFSLTKYHSQVEGLLAHLRGREMKWGTHLMSNVVTKKL